VQRIPHLVVIGGGHSHAIALDHWARQPEASRPPARITLISNTVYAPYSGILPGHIAGFYPWNDCYIDTLALAQRAGVDFLLDRAVGLDLTRRIVELDSERSIAYDFLSLDTGCTPGLQGVRGGKYAIPAKPVPELLTAWYGILDQVRQSPTEPIALTIVGGGAGGVELALTMGARLAKLLDRADLLTVNLIQRGETLLPGHSASVRQILESILRDRGVNIYRGEAVVEIEPTGNVHCASGRAVAGDYVIWVTNAKTASWLSYCGLETDDRGFVMVDDTLRSISHPEVFASGDVAILRDRPLPRAGVYAVRQGKPLFDNWRAILSGTSSLTRYNPPDEVLALIGTGDGRAVASWGRLGFGAYRWLWWIKETLDQRFMAKFARFSD
jgi:selenide,water dikinase